MSFRSLTLFCMVLAGGAGAQSPQYPPLLVEGRSYDAPFAAGEELGFEIRWKPPVLPSFHAGDLTLSLQPDTLEGARTYRIEARAVSSGNLSRIVKVENYYESHVERDSFRSLRMIMRSRQGSRHRDLALNIDYERNRSHVLETDPRSDPPRQIRNRAVRGLPGPMTDIVSVFYAVRLHDLEPGEKYMIHLNDRGRHRKVPISVDKFERVLTALGKFDAVQVSTDGGFLGQPDRRFRIWYSRDADRLPLRFEADAKVGHVSGEIVRMRQPRRIRTIVPAQ